jgi:subtilisin
MHRLCCLCATVVVGGVLVASATAGRYVVVLKNRGDDAALVAQEHAKRFGADVSFVYRKALNGYAGVIPENRLEALRSDGRVLFVAKEREYAIDSDDCDTGPNQCIPNGVDRVEGDLSSTRSGDGSGVVDVDVAVIDTGIKMDHPDLNVVGGVDCVKDKATGFDDLNGHGTHVAGTVAALDNGIGVVGVAPGARLWAARALDKKGKGKDAEILCAIDWVTSTRTDSDPSNDIEVANMSLGGKGTDDGNCGRMNADALHLAICNSVAAGVTYLVAAGNESRDAAGHVPAAYDEVITVSALADFDGRSGGLDSTNVCGINDADDSFASFSNFGPDVDLIAPGTCIWSTWAGGVGWTYAALSGTSMAAPHVTGAAALYRAQNPGASSTQVRAALIASGTFDWNNSDDPDGLPEPLLNLALF